MCPLFGLIKPVSKSSKVDLPEPLFPEITILEFFTNSKFIFSNIVSSLYLKVTFFRTIFFKCKI